MLLIDGEIDLVPTKAGRHVNYAVTQSYGTTNSGILQSRYDAISSVQNNILLLKILKAYGKPEALTLTIL